MDTLPLYQVTINKDLTSDVGVAAIALVDFPAIQVNWQAFKENTSQLNFATINDDEHLIIGAAMIPDLKIYRRDDQMGEYNVVFSKQTVAEIAEKFYSQGLQGKANIMHDNNQPVQGVVYFLSWIKDESKGMVGMSGDYPDGTWFVGARVNNPAVWEKIKSGEIKGFSVEGVFEYEKPQTDEEKLFEQIKNILK